LFSSSSGWSTPGFRNRTPSPDTTTIAICCVARLHPAIQGSVQQQKTVDEQVAEIVRKSEADMAALSDTELALLAWDFRGRTDPDSKAEVVELAKLVLIEGG
jgi:hypothetical protein